MRKNLLSLIFFLLVIVASIKNIYAQSNFTISGKLQDKNNTSISANITLYNAGANDEIITTQTTSDGRYNLSTEAKIYDIEYKLLSSFLIPNFWIKLSSLNITSNLNDLVNYITEYLSENKISFTVNINGSQIIQTYSPEK